MALSALILLTLAALIHAGWNLLAKGAGDKQVFFWLALLAAVAIFLGPFVVLYRPIPPVGWAILAGSGALETGYFLLLGSAYQRGDLSLVYPLARGSAILFVFLFAWLGLGERVAPLGLAGITLIGLGVYTLHLKRLDRAGLLAPFASLRERPSQLAVLTGLTVAGYNTLDKLGVRYVDPFPYLYLALLIPAGALTPYILLAKGAAVRAEWRAHGRAAVAVGVMFTIPFLLGLLAMQAAPVSYVTPVREMAVVFGALLGAWVLHEPFGEKKLFGSLLIFAGIVCIGAA